MTFLTTEPTGPKTLKPKSEAPFADLPAVTPADLEEAKAWVGRHARPRDRALWDARPEETKP
jgi:hypothetical protein